MQTKANVNYFQHLKTKVYYFIYFNWFITRAGRQVRMSINGKTTSV